MTDSVLYPPTMISRTEYPRPQFVREEWLCLNGEWEFAFDDADQGIPQQWQNGQELPQRINVPFAYQTLLSGINDKAVHEVVWYARDFTVPEAWRAQSVLLHFGAVDYVCTLWINGVEVGHNRGGQVPFDFDVSPYLREGVNRLALRVVDRQSGQQPRGKQSVTGAPVRIEYWCTSGIWQSVWLEPVPINHIAEVRFTPHVSGEAGAARAVLEAQVLLHAPSIGWNFVIEVRDGDTVVARAEAENSGALADFRLDIPDAKLWSHRSPHLYDVVLRLSRDGEAVDEVRSYVGLRSVEVREGRVLVNGQPEYLMLVLDQGYWPDGGMTAPSDDALRADVEWCKKFGFNGARKHQKVEDPRWLYWCDKLGLLVWGEMANARVWSHEAEERLAAEWERVVRRDYNAPCIVTWVPVNESFGVDGRDGHPGQYAFQERLVLLTRRLDGTRPIIDNDGWEHTSVTDILAIHDYTPTRAELLERYQDTLRGGALPPDVWGGYPYKVWLRAAEHRGQPVVLSEVGGLLSQPETPREQWDTLYGAYASCGSPEELFEAYADLMRGLSELPFLAGWCYTQLTDIELEINGLLSYDRTPKIAPERIAALHRKLFA